MKIVGKPDKFIQALKLPIIANINPRSAYNKVEELETFIKEEMVDVLFLSESWERENLQLDELIHLENHKVISNVFQRKGKGGRPAIFVNTEKYHVQDITNTMVNIKWGVEAVWCSVTPKNVTKDSKIQKIACAAIYSKPGSKHKSDLLDHLSDAFNILSAKFGNGIHFCIAGDTNELNLNPILSLSPKLVQVVRKPTRVDPITGNESILDPIITTLSQYHQEPLCLEPLQSDPEKNGTKSDHKIVLMIPINEIDNLSARQTKVIKSRPLTQSGIDRMRSWLIDQTWDNIYNIEDSHIKAENFQNMLMSQFLVCFPEKTRKINSDDAPWMTQKLKKLDRHRKRIYRKERKSNKWKSLDKDFKKAVKLSKTTFYQNMIADLKKKNPAQWYSSLKRLSKFDEKSEKVIISEINKKSDQ